MGEAANGKWFGPQGSDAVVTSGKRKETASEFFYVQMLKLLLASQGFESVSIKFVYGITCSDINTVQQSKGHAPAQVAKPM